jgi:hypothetical protein
MRRESAARGSRLVCPTGRGGDAPAHALVGAGDRRGGAASASELRGITSRAAIAGGSCATFFYAINLRTWNMLAVIAPGGGRILRLTSGWERSGLHSWRRCGRRSDGATVKPGVYTIRVSVRLSAGSTAAVGASAKRSLAVR